MALAFGAGKGKSAWVPGAGADTANTANDDSTRDLWATRKDLVNYLGETRKKGKSELESEAVVQTNENAGKKRIFGFLPILDYHHQLSNTTTTTTTTTETSPAAHIDPLITDE